MAKYNGAELFPIVDEKGDVIGSASRKECHSYGHKNEVSKWLCG